MIRPARVLALAAALAAPIPAAAQPAFVNPYAPTDMHGKQAVLETPKGAIVIQLLPDAAPNHVGLFMKVARDGGYNGTAFHRVVKYAVIQGGDPVSRDPARAADWGQGGLNQLRAELNSERLTAGAVAAVADPTRPDSAGSQFFIAVTDQPALDGKYTVFGRVIDGIEVVQELSAVEADAEGRPRSRLELTSVTIRDTPPEPFVNDSPAELAHYRVAVETTMGTLELEMLPDKAPATVRQFLRLAQAGVYDGIQVHRVAPGFVVQTGALNFRQAPLTARQQRLVTTLPPEFTDTPNEFGVVSMARGDDPASGTTSFFVCIGQCRSLDGKYTVFARVAGGAEVLDRIASVPVDGETPRSPIVMTRVRVEAR
jgi:cyclophilin family peptidyl-prolyl cis-trans isomerase